MPSRSSRGSPRGDPEDGRQLRVRFLVEDLEPTEEEIQVAMDPVGG